MKIFAFGLTGLLLSTLAHASNTVAICGETTNADEFSVTGFELMISSEDSDGYKGPVGGSWNMKVKEDGEWLPENKNIKASMKNVDGKTQVEIVMVQGRGPSGPVGTRYVLADLYGEETTLEKWNFGGFTGKVMVGEFKCLTAAD
jgi:hypothetical protein